jgi:DNA polymerase I
MVVKKGILVDVGHDMEGEQSFAIIYLKDDHTNTAVKFKYDPYFYVEGLTKKEIMAAKVEEEESRLITPKEAEEVVVKETGEKALMKVSCHLPQDVPRLKDFIRKSSNAQCYEYDIPYEKRVVLDFGLIPFSKVEIEVEDEEIKGIKTIDESPDVNLKAFAFDMEVYNPGIMPDPRHDPIIMISYADGEENKVISTKGKHENVIKVSSEESLINRFIETVELKDPDVIFGYNTSAFDIPYLLDRARVIGVRDINLSRENGKMRKISRGLTKGFDIAGRIHMDLYPMARLFGRIGVFDAEKFTLYDVYKAVLGKEKLMVDRTAIWELWDNPEKTGNLVDYSLMDAQSTYELGMALLPLEMEISKLSKTFMFDASLGTTGQFVENMLMFYAKRNNTIIPKKPNEQEVNKRVANPIEGAYVKLPEPGIYENIAVLDFRGLYPSIITTYNVDPYTITNDKDNAHTSPFGTSFTKGQPGLLPTVLKEILDHRSKLKEEVKKAKPGTMERKKLEARVQALKIISNSFYGYLGYAKSRWYSRECASSVTAWGRAHIKAAEAEAANAGFVVLYMDTDSLFILMNKKTEKDVLGFMDGINAKLPGDMKLELEDFYTRGVFVAKKSGDSGAKKKYALLSKSGKIKIRGFELVRRDWSRIARETQRAVLDIILREGNKEKAVNYVKEVITRLRGNKVPLPELAISTQLNKDIRDYEIISPELGAAKKLLAKGNKVGMGSLITYVVTKNGRNISDKAEPLESATNYDAEYYINNQIIPSVLKIMKELKVSEQELANAGKQSSIADFFH